MSEERKSTARVRFNLLDVVVILLVALCVVSVWQRDNLKKLFEDDSVTANYLVNFEVADMRESDIGRLAQNATVYLLTEKGSVEIGTVYGSVHTSPTGKSTDEDGGNAEALHTVGGSILCRLMARDGRLWLEDGTEITVNDSFTARTETMDFTIKIVGVGRID